MESNSVRIGRYEVAKRGVLMGRAMQTYHDLCDGPDFFESAMKELKMNEVTYNANSNAMIEADGSMQVSREHKVMFVHVPETGGRIVEKSKLFDHPKKSAVGGYHKINKFHKLEGVNSYVFTSFEHPCERFVQTFDYLKNGGNGTPEEAALTKKTIGNSTLDEFVKKGIPSEYPEFQAMWPFMFLTDKTTGESTMGVDNVFCQDQFEDVEDWIHKHYGSVIPREDNDLPSEKQCQNLKPETRQAIDDFYELDYCIFGFDRKNKNTNTKNCEARSISKSEYESRMDSCFDSLSLETKRRLQKE
eukprot:CAMPEP_0178895430 /NCGR_PEP_ID=MMETSP0786-20121207/583_1 /TAXON_ID=186022 /ORGANISM="Thalassionema frauenfeldii, Strain CCMP 1798" /LENGTH=301 /DNA_ID=CAMNT_0020565661 /DNA_START=1 /DNA_END=903 /DNA_ORIENTATION=+